MTTQVESLQAKLKAARLELKIRERTKNESLKGYERIIKRIAELEEKINEINFSR